MPQATHKLNFAILGAGHIATKMAATLNFLRNEITPYAVASRSIDRANAIRSQFAFAKAYTSYEAMLNDPSVDVVYIATPNSLHAEHTRACLEAGKHVICEKPFTMSHKLAAQLFAFAQSRNLFLMEAVWTRFHPCVSSIRNIIQSGEIGSLRFLQATFALAISHKERLSSPSLGGGALADLGIYPLHFADLYFGLDCSSIHSCASLSPSGVDDQSAITLKYPDGRLASLSTSMTAAYGTSSRIAGTLGCIDLPRLTTCESFTVRQIPSGSERTISTPFDFNGYEYEIRAAAKAIANGQTQCPECSPAISLRIIEIMEHLLQNWSAS